MRLPLAFLLVSVCALSPFTGLCADNGDQQDQFTLMLLADARHASIPPEDDWFGPLLGRWEIEGEEIDGGGKRTAVSMLVVFARTLDGRAVQDTWEWSIDSSQSPTDQNRAVGTTMRIYDPIERVWHVTWFDPVEGRRVQLLAKRVADEIVLDGHTSRGVRVRWVFSDVGTRKFTWRGARFDPDKKTWKTTAEYFASR
jgi:hypothetical protein